MSLDTPVRPNPPDVFLLTSWGGPEGFQGSCRLSFWAATSLCPLSHVPLHGLVSVSHAAMSRCWPPSVGLSLCGPPLQGSRDAAFT